MDSTSWRSLPRDSEVFVVQVISLIYLRLNMQQWILTIILHVDASCCQEESNFHGMGCWLDY